MTAHFRRPKAQCRPRPCCTSFFWGSAPYPHCDHYFLFYESSSCLRALLPLKRFYTSRGGEPSRRHGPAQQRSAVSPRAGYLLRNGQFNALADADERAPRNSQPASPCTVCSGVRKCTAHDKSQSHMAGNPARVANVISQRSKSVSPRGRFVDCSKLRHPQPSRRKLRPSSLIKPAPRDRKPQQETAALSWFWRRQARQQTRCPSVSLGSDRRALVRHSYKAHASIPPACAQRASASPTMICSRVLQCPKDSPPHCSALDFQSPERRLALLL